MAERIGIIGSGIMGAGIAQIAAQNGYEVIMTDVGQEQLDNAVGRITTGLDRGVQRGLFEASVRDQRCRTSRPPWTWRRLPRRRSSSRTSGRNSPPKRSCSRSWTGWRRRRPFWHPTHPRCPSLSWPPSPSGLTRSSGCTSSTHPTPCSWSR